LNGSEDELLGTAFKKAAANHRTVFTSLTKNLSEAKYEHYVRGTEQEYELEKKLVDCMQRLAQHLGGLRSAASTQFSLLALVHGSHPTSNLGSTMPINRESRQGASDGPHLFTPPEHGVITPRPFSSASATSSNAESYRSTIEDPTPSVAIFDQFIFHLGPPMV
jgi:hypothetical protein